MTDFTDAEQDQIRGGVMGAIALVSQADPGFFDIFKESKAASQALASAPEGVKDLMKGGLVLPPQASSKEELKQKMLASLATAVQVAGKNPDAQAAIKSYVRAACQQVAEASKGVSAEEEAMITEIEGVLGGAGTAQVPAGQTAAQPQAQQVQADQADHSQAPDQGLQFPK